MYSSIPSLQSWTASVSRDRIHRSIAVRAAGRGEARPGAAGAGSADRSAAVMALSRWYQPERCGVEKWSGWADRPEKTVESVVEGDAPPDSHRTERRHELSFWRLAGLGGGNREKVLFRKSKRHPK